MRKAIILLVAAVALGTPYKAEAALQCVTYAREVTGLNLKGDAWKWWEAAQGVYDRGNTPKDGAVLVFKRQGSMSHGHVSVVRRIASSRIVLVDHANWAPHRTAGRGQVTESVPVIDVSRNNDWSEVRVWYRPSNEYGSRVYKTQGFVYRPNASVVHSASLRTDTPVAAEPAVPAKAPRAAVKVEAMALPVPPTPVAPAPAKAVEAPVIATPAAAAPEPGKFDAKPWAEQA